jgi:hypothetical protein
VLAAALAGCFLALTPRPAAAMSPPLPPRGPIPPCASGPGGLIGCIPSPSDLLSGAARTAGGGVMKVFTVFFTDGAKWFLDRLQEFLTAPTRPDLSASWWVEKYNLMLALVAVVAAATLLLALIDAAAKGSPEGLGRALFADVPVAGLVGGIGPLVVQYLVDLADWLSGRLLQDLGADSVAALGHSGEWFASFSAATANPAAPLVAGLIAALVTILAAFVIFLELMLRSNAIYLIAALIPVIYAIRIWPAAKTVARRTTEVLIAVIFTLPVVSLAVSMGAAASGALGGVGDASFKDFGTAIAGAVLLLLAALAPWGMIALCRRWRARSPMPTGNAPPSEAASAAACRPPTPAPIWAGWPAPAPATGPPPAVGERGLGQRGLGVQPPLRAGVFRSPPRPGPRRRRVRRSPAARDS